MHHASAHQSIMLRICCFAFLLEDPFLHLNTRPFFCIFALIRILPGCGCCVTTGGDGKFDFHGPALPGMESSSQKFDFHAPALPGMATLLMFQVVLS